MTVKKLEPKIKRGSPKGFAWPRRQARTSWNGTSSSFAHPTFGGQNPARVHALSRPAAPQFSAFHCRAAGFPHRHVDAIQRTALAGLQTDGFGGAAGSVWIREPGADTFFVGHRRGGGGGQPPPPPGGFGGDRGRGACRYSC